MPRPDFVDLTTGQAFNNWYWLKSEMQDICKLLGLPATGRKFDLRDRIMYALDHNGALLPTPRRAKPKSTFDWANTPLTFDTRVTDNITFGPNLRGFFQQHIDRQFSCTSDFMDWVREHQGVTLKECIAQWYVLDNRKRDPTFQREIARNNMFNQYVRDYHAHYPTATFQEVKDAWLRKKTEPMVGGRVVFAAGDKE